MSFVNSGDRNLTFLRNINDTSLTELLSLQFAVCLWNFAVCLWNFEGSSSKWKQNCFAAFCRETLQTGVVERKTKSKWTKFLTSRSISCDKIIRTVSPQIFLCASILHSHNPYTHNWKVSIYLSICVASIYLYQWFFPVYDTTLSAIAVFLITALFISCLGEVLVQNGKVNFTVAYPGLLYCTTVQYTRAFSSSENIRVLASISQGRESLSVHDSAVVWTSYVTQSSFRVCLLESGLGRNGSSIVNWIALRGTPSGMLHGAASFSTFTSGTKCERVNFLQAWFIILVMLPYPWFFSIVYKHNKNSRSAET